MTEPSSDAGRRAEQPGLEGPWSSVNGPSPGDGDGTRLNRPRYAAFRSHRCDPQRSSRSRRRATQMPVGSTEERAPITSPGWKPLLVRPRPPATRQPRRSQARQRRTQPFHQDSGAARHGRSRQREPPARRKRRLRPTCDRRPFGRLGLRRYQRIHELRSRNLDFPAPVVTLRRRMVWNWPDVERWGGKTGRL